MNTNAIPDTKPIEAEYNVGSTRYATAVVNAYNASLLNWYSFILILLLLMLVPYVLSMECDVIIDGL